MNHIQNTEVNQNESNNDSALAVDIQGIDHWGIPDRKTRKQWYQSTNPQIRSYITGNLATNISGKGARSLKRAADEYQYLSEDLAKNSYSSKAMSKKYDNFNGIDSSILDKALENEHKQLNTYQQQFNTGQLSEHKFNRLQRKQGRRINNLNENYQTLSEVWNSKRGIPLVRTQSSVSSLPFVLGTIGLPAAIIGGISGGVAAAPYIGKALANPWVQRGLAGLDAVDTGAQVVSGNYLGAATNLIPYDKIFKYGKKTLDTVKAGRTLYKQNKAARRASALLDENVRYKTHWDKKLDPYQIKTSPYLSNDTDGIPIDSEAFYHTSEHYTGKDNNRSLTPAKGGWLGLKDGKLYPHPSWDGTPGDIWWNKGGVYSSGRTVYVSKSPLINTKVLDHPELYSPLRGSYHDSYYTSKAIPDKDVIIYERNPITHRMVNIHYNPDILKNPHLEYDNDILHYSK